MANEFYARKGLIVPSGNVGIGTTSPAELLHLQSSQPVIRYTKTGVLNWKAGVITGNDYAITADNIATTALTIQSGTGNVGIGTTSPSYALDVYRDISTASYIVGRNGSGVQTAIGVAGDNGSLIGTLSNHNLRVVTNGAVVATITTTGNVGIGTTSPATQLHLNGSAELRMSNSANTTGFDIGLLGGNSDANAYIYQRANSNIIFGTNNTERMRITSTGNVGIGTTAPQSPLHIIAASSADNALFQEWSYTSASTDIFSLMLKQTVTANVVRYNFSMVNNSTAYDNMLVFDRGNIGIGTTSPAYKLDVSKTANDSQPTFRVEGNTYEDSLVYFVNTAVGTGGTGAGGITVQYTVSANNNTDSNFINCSDAVDLRFIVWNNGGIGNFQSNDVDLSDERTKNSITNLESYWDKIKNIEIVKYKYNDQSHDDYNIGVIAQQVEEIAPEFIDNNSWKIKDTEDYYKTVYNKDLQFAAIKVLQEAMIKIEKLEQELETLKNK
jgi:hypothetical protein